MPPLNLRYGDELQATAAAFEKAIKDKQQSDRRWLKFSLFNDFRKFVVSAAATFMPGGAGNAAGVIDAQSAIAQDVRSLTEKTLQPQMPQLLIPLKDTSPTSATQTAWEQVRARARGGGARARLGFGRAGGGRAGAARGEVCGTGGGHFT